MAKGEELVLRALEHLADGHEATAAQAVVGADGELERLDGRVVALGGDGQGGGGGGRGRRGSAGGARRVEEPELVDKDAGGLANGLHRRDGAVGPHFEDHAVEVGGLSHANLLDVEVDLAHGGEDGIDGG